MEMKIEKCFYMLEKAEGKTVLLYDKKDGAVKKEAEYLKSGVKAEEISLTEINTSGEGLKATEVAWSTTAEKLVTDSKKWETVDRAERYYFLSSCIFFFTCSTSTQNLAAISRCWAVISP